MKVDSNLCLTNEAKLKNYYRDKLGISAPSELVSTCSKLPLSITRDVVDVDNIIEHLGGIQSIEKELPGIANGYFDWRERVSVGLHHYVSAYCGIHEPYEYGTKFPIGIFLDFRPQSTSNQIENFTYRDLRSFCKWCGEREIRLLNVEDKMELFLTTENISEFLALNITHKYENRIWKYWGNSNDEDLKQALCHEGGLFKKKFVYNKRDFISLDEFACLLYPSKTADRTKENEFYDSHTRSPKFQRIKQICDSHSIIVYPYKYDENAIFPFLETSFAVAHFKNKYGEWPDDLSQTILRTEIWSNESNVPKGILDERDARE